MLCITPQDWDKAHEEGSDFATTADPKQPLKALKSCPHRRDSLEAAAWCGGFWCTMAGRYHKALGYPEDKTTEAEMDDMPNLPHGRCDTCGAAVGELGSCMSDPNHQVINNAPPPVVCCNCGTQVTKEDQAKAESIYPGLGGVWCSQCATGYLREASR